MTIKINLHKTHRQHTDGQEIIETEGSTIGECLNDLVAKFPKLKDEIFDKKGALLSVLEVYLNGASAYPDELKREVADGDEIHLITMLAGG